MRDDIESVADPIEKAFDAAFDAENLEAFRAELASISLAFEDLGDEAAKDLKRMNEEIDSALGVTGAAAGATWTSAFGAGLAGIGPAILNALQGGGNVVASVGSAFGLSFTQHMFG